MSTVRMTTIVDAPALEVWDVISDFHHAHRFHPLLADIEPVGELDRGVGAIRRCHLTNGQSQIEEVIDWHEGHSFRVVSPDAPIVDDVVGGMSVEAISDTQSRVTIDISYQPRWGVLGVGIDRLILRTAFRLVLRRVARGLEDFMAANAMEAAR